MKSPCKHTKWSPFHTQNKGFCHVSHLVKYKFYPTPNSLKIQHWRYKGAGLTADYLSRANNTESVLAKWNHDVDLGHKPGQTDCLISIWRVLTVDFPHIAPPLICNYFQQFTAHLNNLWIDSNQCRSKTTWPSTFRKYSMQKYYSIPSQSQVKDKTVVGVFYNLIMQLLK